MKKRKKGINKYINMVNPLELSKRRFYSMPGCKSFYDVMNSVGSYSDEEHDMAIALIKQGTEKSRAGHPCLAEYPLFAMGYPESCDLVKEHFDLLRSACKKATCFVGRTNGFSSPFYRNVKCLDDQINDVKFMSVYIFVKKLIDDDRIKDTQEILDQFGISLDDWKRMLSRYRYNLSKKQKECSTIVGAEYDKAKEIYDKLMAGSDVGSIRAEYNLYGRRLRSFLKAGLSPELFSQLEEKLYDDNMDELAELDTLSSQVFDIFSQGVSSHNYQTVPFTCLDYFSMTDISLKKFMNYIHDSRHFDGRDKELMSKRSGVKRYFGQNAQRLGRVLEKDELKGYSITINGELYTLEDYADQIWNLFEENNIPAYHANVCEALRRIARGQEVLPIIESKKRKLNLND